MSKLNYERLGELLAAAENILAAYESAVQATIDAAASAHDAADFRARIAAIVASTDYRPSLDASLTLALERREFDRNLRRARLSRAATASSRARQASGERRYSLVAGDVPSVAIASYLAKQAEIAELAQAAAPAPTSDSAPAQAPQALRALDGHGAAALDFGASADAHAENEK